MQFSFIQPIDRVISDATIPGQSEPGSSVIEGVLHISQSPSITGTSPSDCLVSYLGHSLRRGSYPSAEVHSVYSAAPANWAIYAWKWNTNIFLQDLNLDHQDYFEENNNYIMHLYIYIYISMYSQLTFMLKALFNNRDVLIICFVFIYS